MGEEQTDAKRPTLLAPGTKVLRWTVDKHLGEGGMGDVFRVRDDVTSTTMALKLLKQEWSTVPHVAGRFREEPRVMNAVNHPGVVRVVDSGRLPPELGGNLYIAMEFLDGVKLDEHFKKLAESEKGEARRHVWGLGYQIASTLSAAHRNNVVHRDIKPDNIMVVRDPLVPFGFRARVLDFGIAKIFSDAEASVPKERSPTEEGWRMGTFPYWAPEQQVDAKEAKGPADVYALGVTLLEGFGVDVRRTHGEWKAAIAALTDFPEDGAKLLRSMVDVDAAKRPSAEAVERACQRLSSHHEAFAPALAQWLEERTLPELEALDALLAWSIGRELEPIERDFLAACVQERERIAQQRTEEQRKRAEEQHRLAEKHIALAEAARQTSDKLERNFRIMLGLLAAVVIAGVVAVTQWFRVQDEGAKTRQALALAETRERELRVAKTEAENATAAAKDAADIARKAQRKAEQDEQKANDALKLASDSAKSTSIAKEQKAIADAERAKARQTAVEAEAELARATSDVGKLRSANGKLQTEVADLNRANDKLDTSFKLVLRSLELKEKAFNDATAALTREKEGRDKDKERLQREKDELSAEKARLARKLTELEASRVPPDPVPRPKPAPSASVVAPAVSVTREEAKPRDE